MAMMSIDERDAPIVEAWFGPLARCELSARFGVSPRSITRLWGEARARGELPAGARPHFSRRAKVTVVGEQRVDERIDETGEIVSITATHDPLLAALQRVHGADPRRQHDDLTTMLERHAASQKARRHARISRVSSGDAHAG